MNLHEYITFPLLETALISIPLSGAGSWSPCLPRWRYQGSSFSSVSLLLLPRFSLSLGPGSALGGKGKSNRRGRKKPQVRFACRYFSYFAPFFCFCLLRIAPLRSLVPGYSSLSPLFFFFFFFFGFKMTAAIIYSGIPLYNEVPGYRKNCSL